MNNCKNLANENRNKTNENKLKYAVDLPEKEGYFGFFFRLVTLSLLESDLRVEFFMESFLEKILVIFQINTSDIW